MRPVCAPAGRNYRRANAGLEPPRFRGYALMDLFRYFHPHHSPRLRGEPLRLQELGELQQAADELRRALFRAKLRAETAPVVGVEPDQFAEVLAALEYVVASLSELLYAHPGDDTATLLRLADERRGLPGWDLWASAVRERLEMLAGGRILREGDVRSNNEVGREGGAQSTPPPADRTT